MNWLFLTHLAIVTLATLVKTSLQAERKFSSKFILLLGLLCLMPLKTGHAQAQATAFNFTNTTQTYTVPPNVHVLTAKLWGAGGACRGGGGAFIYGRLAVTPGEVLTVVVGGGGLGGTYGNIGSSYGGGGSSKGRSDVLCGSGGGIAGIFRGSTPLAIAGAGAGGCQITIGARMGHGGGGGGIAAGTAGGPGIAGGSQSAAGRNGGYLQGGNNIGDGTGGGSGFYGGGSGYRFTDYNVYGGGGGSSYVPLLGDLVAEAAANGVTSGPENQGARAAAGGMSDPDYVSGIGIGGAGGTGQNGGNARIVIRAVADNPVPTLTSVTPATGAAGGADVRATVIGTGFVTASQVNFAGVAVATTYVSPTELQATIPLSAVTAAGIYNVTVTSPLPGGGVSGAAAFLVRSAGSTTLGVSAGPRPVITRVGSALQVTIPIVNTGSNAALGVSISGAKLNAVNASSITPTSISTIAVGGTTSIVLTFPASAAATGTAPFVTLTYGSQNAGVGSLSVRCGAVP